MINKYSNIPLYSQLKNLILEKIESGDYPENSKIPSEEEMCEAYNISRPTVRQAITELTNNGYLYKEKGKGTFVAKSKSIVDMKSYSGFSDSILDSQVPGDRDIIQITETESHEDKRLHEIFGIQQNQRVGFVQVHYVSKHQGETFSYNTSLIPLNLFPGIAEDIKSKKPSYDILRGKYPLIPVKSKSSLEIIYTDHSEAHYLQVQPGQALIKIENIMYSKSGQAVEYVISKYRADKCRLLFENVK
ncbi:MAG: GntR family transcriptional regulator [Clostridia bacterium]|nr:GntR family transcriptional regulator [Clostridia bacterium]